MYLIVLFTQFIVNVILSYIYLYSQSAVDVLFKKKSREALNEAFACE